MAVHTFLINLFSILSSPPRWNYPVWITGCLNHFCIIQLHFQVGKFFSFNSKSHIETKTKQSKLLHPNNPTENYFS